MEQDDFSIHYQNNDKFAPAEDIDGNPIIYDWSKAPNFVPTVILVNGCRITDKYTNPAVHKKFTKQIWEYILEEIACTTKPLRLICSEVGIAYGTLKRWIRSDEELRAQYEIAKQEQMDEFADDIVYISQTDVKFGDMANANMKKLQVETKKFLMEKMHPRRYGKQDDKMTVEIKPQLNKDQFDKFIGKIKAVNAENKQIESEKSDDEDEDDYYDDHQEIK